jgi:hypothetical protein
MNSRFVVWTFNISPKTDATTYYLPLRTLTVAFLTNASSLIQCFLAACFGCYLHQEIEICAVKLHNVSTNIYIYIYILTVYRSPTGNFLHFLNSLESILARICRNPSNILLCGDINVNYLDDGCTKRHQVDSLLASHNLCGVVNFPTRIIHSSATTTDNFSIDKCRNEA